MSHACHRFWTCYKAVTFCSLLTSCTIPCACQAERHLNVQKWSEHVVSLTFWPRNVLHATRACTCFVDHPNFKKVFRSWSALYILTWKCASHHNGVHFFDISTSKSVSWLSCFGHLTWKCASRHNGVQLFISHLTAWLHIRRFSDSTFLPSGATNHWEKHSVSRLSYLFAHLDLLSLETFLFLIFFLFLIRINSTIHIMLHIHEQIYIYIYICPAVVEPCDGRPPWGGMTEGSNGNMIYLLVNAFSIATVDDQMIVIFQGDWTHQPIIAMFCSLPNMRLFSQNKIFTTSQEKARCFDW